ncbi:MAG: DedA family protein [Bacteroidaceae bacterium]|nr:DedA family protein [Bacteroidaceae bacterium]
MHEFTQFLIDIGVPGMFIAAFLAGSVAPFSSEVVMVGLAALGVSPTELLVWGTLGNTLGAVLNYWIGSLGKTEWITRYLHVKPERLQRGMAMVYSHGAWCGLLAFLPVLGSMVSVSLGYMRVSLWRCTLAFLTGKLVRYWVLLAATEGVLG